MADEERTPDEIRIVRAIADGAEDFSNPLSKLDIRSINAEATANRFSYLVHEVEQAMTGGSPFLSEERRRVLSQSFAASLQVFAFYERLDLPYVLALRGAENVYRATIIVDIFRPQALRGLGLDANQPPPSDRPGDWTVYRRTVDRLADRKEDVQAVPREIAARNFTTLFVDTLRGIAGIFRSSGSGAAPPTTVFFEVDSQQRNYGYALSVYPQHRYTPVPWGGTQRTRPVKDNIAIGHWGIEGWKNGKVTRDHRPHFASPKHTSTQTVAF